MLARPFSSSHPISFLSPYPLSPAPVGLLALNNPPPSGGGTSQLPIGLPGRADSRSACLTSCRAALSLRSFATAAPHDVIAVVPSAHLPRHRPFPPSSRYRPLLLASLPSSPHLPMSSPPFYPPPASLSPTMPINACWSYPSRLPPRPPCRTTGRGYGSAAGYSAGLLLPCLLAPCHSSPRVNGRGAAGISSRHRHLVRPCLLAYTDGRRACAMAPCGVAFSCFPVGAFQSFLKCCRVNALKPCGYPAIRYGSVLPAR